MPLAGSQSDLTVPVVSDAIGRFERNTSPAAPTPKDVVTMGVAELLTALLGAGARSACACLDAHHLSWRQIASLYPAELRDLGFSNGAIEKLSAMFELAKRYGEEEFVPGQPFRGSADVYAHYRQRLADDVVEHFFVILLDNKHRKLRDVQVSQGSLTSSVVHPRDVFMVVIRNSAAAVIFVHNHPSGDPTPSQEDLALTRRLREVGELVGVRVLDHIIIGKGRYVSFVDDGYW